MIFRSRKRGHDFAGLLWEIGCSADDHNRLETFRLHGRHVQQDVASHADSDGFAALDAEMIEQSQGVEGAVAVGKRLRQLRPIGNGRAAVTAHIGNDQPELALELLTDRICPVGMTSSAAVKEEQRLAFATKLVVQDDAVQR